MRVSFPESVTSAISQSAMRKAREDMRSRGWKSMKSIHPHASEGVIGLRTTVNYLMFQNRGTRPRVMWELEGKVIPMKGEDGVHFVRAVGVGQPGFVNIPGVGKIWREQRWRHPGIKPKRFLENSLMSAVSESRSLIQDSLMKILMGEEQ